MVRIRRLLDGLSSAIALLGIAPVVAFLDRPLVAAVLLALLAGLWCDRQQRYFLPNRLAVPLALVSLLIYLPQLTRDDVATPLVHVLVGLLAIRLLQPKQARDYLQIFVLALILLAGSSLISLDAGFLAYLVLQIFAVTVGLVLLTVFVSQSDLRLTRRDLAKLLRVALLLPIGSLLLMVFFFLILPRTQHPLWNFLNPKEVARTGLAESVQPGSFARIAAVRNLAFRAEAPEMAPEDLYWRALVLNRPLGGQWVRLDPPEAAAGRLLGGRPVTVVIYPEPRNDTYLVTLDRPASLTGLRHQVASDQTYRSRRSIDQRLRYEVLARPGASQQVAVSFEPSFYLQVPPVSARVEALAAQLIVAAPEPAARLEALAELFRGRQLVYAEDDLPAGDDVIGQFLFDKRRGYCEFFASAYVTLARLAGIPARLVGGYLGGEYNPLGGYYLVTEDRAHVWVEVLTAERQWQRVDPSLWAINAAATLGARAGVRPHRLQLLIDSLNYHWVQAVVVFDLARQIEFLREAGRSVARLRKPQVDWRPLGLVVGGVVLFGVAGLCWRRRLPRPEERLLRRLRQRVRRRYGETAFPTSSGLTELAERLQSPACREFARIYQAAVFCDRRLGRTEVERLKALLRQI
ncbi:MAG: transglutaminaseTgpA domain-containing protein [Desulfuromonadales bacterium]|nr:transglutaminaseTgpA domain-containing protein [Desulfuromonadales bacterium]